MRWIFHFLLNVLALYVVAHFVTGIRIDTISSAIMAAIVLGLFNTILRPILQILSLPITIMTFGIFALVINAVLFGAVSLFVPGFHVHGIAAAFVGSILVSIVSWILHKVFQA